MLVHLKNGFLALLYASALAVGVVYYLIRKRTPSFAYQSMIKLFCLTRGRSNDVISKVISFFKPPVDFAEAKGVLGDLSLPLRRREIVSTLRKQGYYVFKGQLSEQLCDRLLEFATSQPAMLRRMDDQDVAKSFSKIYRRDKVDAVRYDFATSDLLANADVQKLLADFSFAALAQDYLGSRPVIDVLAMWWHTAYSDKPDSQAAQFFHFDMDRPKWLKVFIYLTDVSADNGPHSFVAGSHATGAIPDNLLRKGYARLTDEEVGATFAKESIIEFSAPRGTIIVEDTRGLHKGKHVHVGDRLLLQLQFSNCLFGGDYPVTMARTGLCDELASSAKLVPWLYSAYLVKE